MEQQILKQSILNLTPLEIFFIVTTIISLFFNLYQLMLARREKSAVKAPLTNSLIALFNDVKSKSLFTFIAQQKIVSLDNPHTDIATLKWDYVQFTQNVQGALSGFQETLVGVLVTLNPDDPEGKRSFRAADYGLTEQEKERKKQYMQQFQIGKGAGA